MTKSPPDRGNARADELYEQATAAHGPARQREAAELERELAALSEGARS